MKNFLLKNSLPNWIILLIDQVITSWSFALSLFIIKQFEFTEILRGHFLILLGVYCLVSLSTFYRMRLHTGLIRYSSIQDIYRIFTAVLISSVIYGFLFSFVLVPVFQIDTTSIFFVLLVNFSISSSLLIMLRIGTKSMFTYIKRNTTDKKETVLIYGSNMSSILVKEALEASGMGKYTVLGFVDENSANEYKRIHLKRIYHTSEVKKLNNQVKIDKLVILNELLAAESPQRTIDKCLELGIKVLTVPPTMHWISGRLHLNQLQDLRIEDLLHRAPIIIKNERIFNDLSGKRVLVTGGAGSIGSEIVRQVLSYNPEMLIVCDQAESPLHELQLEIEENFPNANIKVVVGNVQNFDRMYTLFKAYMPQVVYHAAAYKHVPMMEHNPWEAIHTNILGTKNLADLAVSFDVDRFVMLSTDKAVNPTNIMGASKRIAEIYIQSLNYIVSDNLYGNSLENMALHKTKFITTRFGNVLGSNGSVIPRFKSQIQKGGPVTVTDPEITRYFMTIQEAVQLVLEAGVMGNGGEIFVFDMGQPVKIADLAEKMIKLSGYTPNVDIKIVYTGLRPGEKLYEELLNKEEETIPTHHEKIKISKVRVYENGEIIKDINDILSMSIKADDYNLVKKMKQIVPEFISKNSKYEVLDYQMK